MQLGLSGLGVSSVDASNKNYVSGRYVSELPIYKDPELVQKERVLKVAEDHLAKIEVKVKKKQTTLETHEKSWLGWLVCKLDSSNLFLDKINSLFLFLSKSFREETRIQIKLKKEIDSLLLDKKEYLEKTKPLLEQEIEELRQKEQVMDLFGGEKEFEQVPVLNLRKTRILETDPIKPSEMTSSLMRGVDKDDRIFFVIKAGNKCQTFFQENGNWYSLSHSGDNLFFIKKYLVEGGSFSDLGVRNGLKKLIQTGSVNFRKLSQSKERPYDKIALKLG